MKKWIALLLSLCMLLGLTACTNSDTQETAANGSAATAVPTDESAAATDEPAATTTAGEMDDSTVLATVYGQDITWGQISYMYDDLVLYYGSYYDLSQQSNVDLFKAVALDEYITDKVIEHNANALNLSLTDEEIKAAQDAAASDWSNALADYAAAPENEGATEEDAIAFYNNLGYNPEVLKQEYVKYALQDKVQAYVIQDVVVTDADVEKLYQDLVAADKELYGSDLSAYINYNGYVQQMESYAAYYGTENTMDYAWYRPAGFRLVKHILLSVDETLMNDYLGLQAQLEEQMHPETEEEIEGEPVEGEETADGEEAVEGEETEQEATPVTQEQVDNAKAAILSSVADTVQEINDKLNNGSTFDELMAEYSMDYREGDSNTYEVSVASTLVYVPEFVEAAFSVENVGDISAPYISDFGVHILMYVEELPEGPIEMTEAQRQQKYNQMLTSMQDEQYSSTVEAWKTEANVVYTDALPSLSSLLEAQAAEDEVPVDEEVPVE